MYLVWLCHFPVSSAKPQPYETDLSYLEEQFELIETLLKARKSETNEDGYPLRPDQRKPEAVARELRAKARGLQARVQQRMEATRKNGGTVGVKNFISISIWKKRSAPLRSIQSAANVQGTNNLGWIYSIAFSHCSHTKAHNIHVTYVAHGDSSMLESLIKHVTPHHSMAAKARTSGRAAFP